MDNETRKQPLEKKLRANAQRRGREMYLAQLPLDFSEYLGQRPCLFTPELDEFCRYWYPLGEQGIDTAQHAPLGYRFKIVYRPEQALVVAEEFGVDHDAATAVLLPELGLPPSTKPGFIIEFGWARQHFVRLWPYSPLMLAVIKQDLGAGLVIDNYASYPAERNPNPEGIAFEVGAWG